MLKILSMFAVFVIPVIAFQALQDKDWPQEPDGFNGLKFLATKADVEKVVKLGPCKRFEGHNPTDLEVKECKVALVLGRINLDIDVHFTSEKGWRDGDSQLTQIPGFFGMANYATVKAAFIKMYGEPHLLRKLKVLQKELGDPEGAFWHGKKANIILAPDVVIFSPSEFRTGGVSVSNHFDTGSLVSTAQSQVK